MPDRRRAAPAHLAVPGRRRRAGVPPCGAAPGRADDAGPPHCGPHPRINTIRAHKHSVTVFPRTDAVYATRTIPAAAVASRAVPPGHAGPRPTRAQRNRRRRRAQRNRRRRRARRPARHHPRINTIRGHKHSVSVFPRTDAVYATRTIPAAAVASRAVPPGHAGPRPTRARRNRRRRRARRPARRRPRINTIRAHKHSVTVFPRTDAVYATRTSPHRRGRARANVPTSHTPGSLAAIHRTHHPTARQAAPPPHRTPSGPATRRTRKGRDTPTGVTPLRRLGISPSSRPPAGRARRSAAAGRTPRAEPGSR
ncbi:hypothetical protein QE392_001606 [Microbacterium proteolyticum]|nr:hypothetical protein [Microbacterium sp. SORGH_AS_0344]MDQ1169802.1 hypothetical protein [Microbacterium proteolyticum]